MEALFKKLRLKDQSPILILNSPPEYDTVKGQIDSEIHTVPSRQYSFVQLFGKDLETLGNHAESVVEALEEGGYLWVCYPKGSSKMYKSDCKRNTVLEVFGPFGFEGVTQVSIDEDWSAMRIRPVDEIKSMKRKWAYSEKGKVRIKDNR